MHAYICRRIWIYININLCTWKYASQKNGWNAYRLLHTCIHVDRIKGLPLSPRIHSHFRFIYAKLGTLFDHTHCRVIQPIFMNDMLISWHENAFFINGLLWKEFIRDQWIPLTKDNNKDVWHFHLLLVWTSCWNGCVADDLRHNGSHGTSL